MIESIAMGLLTNIVSSIVYDAAKKGLSHCFYSSSKNELLEQLNENYKNSQYTQQEIKDTLNELKNNQNLMFIMLSRILNKFDLKTTLNVYNNQITFYVPASDIFKLQQVCCNNDSEKTITSNKKEYSLIDAISTIPNEEEILALVNTVKKHFVVAVPTKPKSVVFEEWYRAKCGKKAIFFEINKTSYYSISRAVIYKDIKHEPRLYVVNTTDLYNYTYYEAVENQALSDGNNIVIKVNADKGYIVAVSGALI